MDGRVIYPRINTMPVDTPIEVEHDVVHDEGAFHGFSARGQGFGEALPGETELSRQKGNRPFHDGLNRPAELAEQAPWSALRGGR